MGEEEPRHVDASNSSASILWEDFELTDASAGVLEFPKRPDPRYKCPDCGTRFRKQQHHIRDFGQLAGYCPHCFLSKIAYIVGAPQLEEVGADE